MIVTLNRVSNPTPKDFIGVKGSTIPIVTPVGTTMSVLNPVQIAGLVPFVCVDQDPRLPAFSKCDCREWVNDDCYINPVFASLTDSDPLKNDHNMFLLEYPFIWNFQFTNFVIPNSFLSLEVWDGNFWSTTSANLANNSMGTYYDFLSKCIPNWKGFDIDWRKVLIAFGEGLYRIRSTSVLFGNTGYLVTEPFCLKQWSCKGTHATVRWETTMAGGSLGSIIDDKRVFNFCCSANTANTQFSKNPVVTWRDQIRVYGFFGKEKTEYERQNIEYNSGEVKQIRNEAIQKFEYESALQPKWIHDRLKAYAFMADELYVTDYNWNNSDYDIKKKRVICDGAYEPEYHRDTRYSWVKVQFKEGFQNVVRDKCCSPNHIPAGTT